MSLNLAGWCVVLDSDHATDLATFYEKLLGWQIFTSEEYSTVVDTQQVGLPSWLTFQQVDDYQPPVWPTTRDQQQQMAHLDFHVEDVATAVQWALSCGATLSPIQFDDRWRVMLDPAGHPFCLLPKPDWMTTT